MSKEIATKSIVFSFSLHQDGHSVYFLLKLNTLGLLINGSNKILFIFILNDKSGTTQIGQLI